MANDNKSFGDYIKELRNAKKETNPSFSVRGLAEKVKVSATYLSKVERGELPASESIIYKLAEVLEVNAEVLFAQAGKIEPKLEEQIASHKSPENMAAFLRIASGLSKERLDMYRCMIEAGEKSNPEEKNVKK